MTNVLPITMQSNVNIAKKLIKFSMKVHYVDYNFRWHENHSDYEYGFFLWCADDDDKSNNIFFITIENISFINVMFCKSVLTFCDYFCALGYKINIC